VRGDSVQKKLTLAWRGPYKVVGIIGDVDHSAEIEPGNVKTYHINMMRQYFHRRKPKHDSNAQLINIIGLYS